jgi:hypothetical protein
VRRERRLDDCGALEDDVGPRNAVEQPLARCGQHGRDRQRELVHDAGREILAKQVGTAHDDDVLARGGRVRPRQRVGGCRR